MNKQGRERRRNAANEAEVSRDRADENKDEHNLRLAVETVLDTAEGRAVLAQVITHHTSGSPLQYDDRGCVDPYATAAQAALVGWGVDFSDLLKEISPKGWVKMNEENTNE